MVYRFEIKRGKNGEFFWRVMHRNGKEIGRSSETYKRKATLRRVLVNLINEIVIVGNCYELIDEE